MPLRFVFLGITLLTLTALVIYIFLPQGQSKTNQLVLNYTVERAETADEQARGLMYRESLCGTCGMIFVFPDEAPRSFWMKNTYISLDMIFIDTDGRIITIHKNTIPRQETILYTSESAKYVLELNAGDSDKLGLAVGTYIDIPALLKESKSYQII